MYLKDTEMHTYRATVLLLSFLLTTTSYCTHKIVYLVSPPRSLSVAFLRMMQTRGDFSIMHEPSQLAFNRLHSPELVQSWYRPSAFQSFDEVKTVILQEAEDRNVFVKEMSFAVRDFHVTDFELMKNPNVYFVFLVRTPHATTISMYNKLKQWFDCLDIQFRDLVGYKAQSEIFMAVKNHGFHAPYLILTEDLYTNPQNTIQKFCDHIGIEFKPESLHWSDLGASFDGQEQWHEIKYKELTNYWHSDAIGSTGFGKPRSYEIDEQGNPTFCEIENQKHREMCLKVYHEHMIYYLKLLEQGR